MDWLARLDTFLFDLDGTLTVPVIDFPALRRALGIAPGQSILHALDALPAHERAAKDDIVRQAEMEAARKTRPNDGALELVHFLQQRGFGTALITRNNEEAARLTLEMLDLTFPVVLAREHVRRVKPAPDAALKALELLGRRALAALMVGDWHDDISCGRQAGARTCLVTNGRELGPSEADIVVETPRELHARLRLHLA